MTAGTLLLASALDAALGDPRWLPHPVRLMGRVITWYDHAVRKRAVTESGALGAGILLALGLSLLSYGTAWIILELAGRLSLSLGKIVEVYLAFTTLAARDLADHVSAVYQALKAGRQVEAREAVARIVGRDTAQLPESEVVRAAVETVAESSCDGIIAPLFYLALGGVPLGLAYKAINTLDSMVGHRDPEYRSFGWASARLDDLANWVPARMTAGLLVLSAALVRRRGAVRDAWRILGRDGKKHPSPNAGRPEAAMAGALGVRLGGRNTYGGIPEERPALGESIRPLTADRIQEALVVMWSASALAVALAAAWLML